MISELGSFLALTPSGNSSELKRLAGQIVTELDQSLRPRVMPNWRDAVPRG